MKNYRTGLLFAMLIFVLGEGFSQPWHNARRRDYSSHSSVSVIASIPFGAVALSFGNRHYHYYNGLYYQPVPAGYTLVQPPVGIIVPMLPSGSVSVIIGQGHYFRYQNIFYIPLDNNRYQVTESPVAAAIDKATPAPGYEKLVIDGKTYYKKEDKYYKARLSDGGEVVYEEVGKVSK